MRINRIIMTAALSLSCTLIASQVQAHRTWIVPSITVVSGDSPWIPFDAAVSNDLFYPNHFPLSVERMKLIMPNGNIGEIHNAHKSKYRSTFDVNLTLPGTYKVEAFSAGLSARWEDKDGKRKFWPPRGKPSNSEEFRKKVPKQAKGLEVSYRSNRIETWVTAGDISDEVLAPNNEGLEMVSQTHPNDFVSGEQAKFQFLIDGKAATGATVTIIRGGTRYRNSQEELKLTTDEQGFISVEWKKPGMYWLSANYKDDNATAPATMRIGRYTATMEVLPE